MPFRVSPDLFTDLPQEDVKVRIYLPRYITAATWIQNRAHRKIITYKTRQSCQLSPN